MRFIHQRQPCEVLTVVIDVLRVRRRFRQVAVVSGLLSGAVPAQAQLDSARLAAAVSSLISFVPCIMASGAIGAPGASWSHPWLTPVRALSVSHSTRSSEDSACGALIRTGSTSLSPRCSSCWATCTSADSKSTSRDGADWQSPSSASLSSLAPQRSSDVRGRGS